MSHDPIDTSATSKTESSDPIVPETNYSRWMTDMAADIARLRVRQLAIPGAHNSGVDMAATWGAEELWGANQDKSFPEQLAAGARHLDLRLVDSSYTKTSGRHSPVTKFYEVFEFKHGLATGRRLEHLIRDVKNFITANPGEIVILDFHKYDKGRFSHTSLERCLPYFNPIKDLLIPSEATDLTIAEIRQKHPGRSIILYFNHGAPANWNIYMWGYLGHSWTAGDSSDASIEELVIQQMKSPPNSGVWALSASVYSTTGPKHLDRDHPVRVQTFKEGFLNCNIVMVDFIERLDTQISVTDRCIALNKRRATDQTAPSAPKDLIVRKLRADDVEDGNYQNTLLFHWTPSTDNLGVFAYEIFKDDVFFETINTTNHRIKDFPKINTTFKVRALDIKRNYSEFSTPVTLIQDSVPPTLPQFPGIRRYGFPPQPTVLIWNPSYDEAGVAGYEMKVNGEYFAFYNHVENLMQIQTIPGLSPTEKYVFEIRAKDINGFYSEYVTLIRHPLPRKLFNPSYTLIPVEDGSSRYRAFVTWDVITETIDSSMKYGFKETPTYTVNRDYIQGQPPTFSTTPYQVGSRIRLESFITTSSVAERSESDFVDIVFDTTPPQPVTNISIPSQTLIITTITWTHSPSSNVIGYAISLNEAAPKLVPASENGYDLYHPPLDNQSTIEIWAINDKGIPSVSESITFDPIERPPAKPIDLSAITTENAASVNWHSGGSNTASYFYNLTGRPERPTNVPNVDFFNLLNNTSYTITVIATNEKGERSDPATLSFRTKQPVRANQPRDLRVTANLNKTVTIAWAEPLESSGLTGYTVTVLGKPTNISEPTHTIFNLIPYLPLIIGVLARYGNDDNSEFVYITVIPNP